MYAAIDGVPCQRSVNIACISRVPEPQARYSQVSKNRHGVPREEGQQLPPQTLLSPAEILYSTCLKRDASAPTHTGNQTPIMIVCRHTIGVPAQNLEINFNADKGAPPCPWKHLLARGNHKTHTTFSTGGPA